MFGDILGQRYLTVASRRYGSKVVVAVSVVSLAQLSHCKNLWLGTLSCLLAFLRILTVWHGAAGWGKQHISAAAVE